jgi:hypothetical protein
MIGGLLKSASRLALVATAGVLVGGVSAQAADLGGNCCADLEERVAELEATTARKGNRKVSLTVYGQVNWAVMYWDDGTEKNTYIVDNNNSRSRFGFKGEAKIDADWSAGYLIEIGVRRNDSNNVTQSDARTGTGLDIRHEALYLDSKRLGRVWLGWTSSATDGITEINLGATAASAFDRSGYLGNFNSHSYGLTWNQLAARADQNWSSDDSRRELIRYVSPTIAGFTASASWGGDDFWDVALRYAGEFSGFRLAAGVGYNKTTQNDDAVYSGGANTGLNGCVQVGATIDCSHLGASASIMHVPTGLFVSGAYSRTKDNNVESFIGPGFDDTDKAWYVSAGIQQKWMSYGATTIYGEYGNHTKGAFVSGIDTFSGSKVKVWTIGINQSIDAAAMDLYLFYSRVSGDANQFEDCTSSGTPPVITCGAGGGKLDADNLQMVVGGAVIRF